MRKIERIIIDSKGKKYLVKDINEEFHTSLGTIKKEDLKKIGRIESTNGNKFTIIKPSFNDLWENLKRGPQIMQQKDIGLVITKTGLSKDSIVVDAGGGSGSLCLSLAKVCKKITVYETNPEHYDIIAKNIKMFGFDNLTLKQANVYDGIDEKEIDLLTLDLPEPWRVDLNGVKLGGWVVVYLPNLTQVKMFIDSVRNVKVIEIVELLERKWKIEGKIMRPEFEMLGHTGFLVFCRKL